MSAGLLATVAVAYLWVSFGYWREGRYGMLMVFISYALANLGFILDMRK